MDAELIPAICPKCGGSLQVDPSLDTLHCQYCGTEHVVRHQVFGGVTLEAYARCPICQRNDQAEKVTAILNKQVSQSEQMEVRQQIFTDSQGRARTKNITVPVQSVRSSNLARQLTPPQAPREKAQGRPFIVLPVFAAGLCLIGVGCGMLALSNPSSSSGAYPTINSSASTFTTCAVLSFVVSLVVLGIWLLTRGGDKERKALEADRVRDARERWQAAMARWGKLYYCGRDDVVFLPGEKTSAPADEMREYIYSKSG